MVYCEIVETYKDKWLRLSKPNKRCDGIEWLVDSWLAKLYKLELKGIMDRYKYWVWLVRYFIAF